MNSSLSPRPVALLLLCVWLAAASLPLGANRPWALALVLPPLFLLAMVVAWQQRASAGQSLLAWLARPPGLWLGGFLLLLVVQCLPLWGEPVSVAPARTMSFLLVALGCAVCGWLVMTLVRESSDIRVLLYGLVGCGLLQAAIAVFLMATQTTLSMLDNEIVASGVATGTFQNRNHLAAWLYMALAAGIGELMGRLGATSGDRTWKQRLRDWLELMLSGKARLRLLLVLLVIVLITTRSRMGNSAFFFGLLFAATVYAFFARSRRRGLLILVASLVLVDLVLIGAWVGVDKVMERVQQTSLHKVKPATATADAAASVNPAPAAGSSATAAASGAAESSAEPAAPAEQSVEQSAEQSAEQSVEERTDPALEAVSIVRDHPLLGTGGGTFYVAYMAYALQDHGFYNHAHNDYLEIAADTGLLGIGLLGGLAVVSFITCIRILRHRRNVQVRAAAFAGLMALACLAMHSLVEFNLQIPVNAWMFTLLVMLPLAAARVRSGSGRRRLQAAFANPADTAAPGGQARAAGAVLTLLTFVLLGWAGYTAVRFGVADYAALSARARMTLWEQGEIPLTADAVDSVQKTLRSAITIMPENPDLYETLGNAYFARALLIDNPNTPELNRTAGQRHGDLAEAANAYRASLRRNRVSGYTWGNLLLAKSRLYEFDAEFQQALANAARYGPYEPNVQVMIVGAGLAAWDLLSPESQRVVAHTVDRGWDANRDRLADEARVAEDPQMWCDLSPSRRPVVKSPDDIAPTMFKLCQEADRRATQAK